MNHMEILIIDDEVSIRKLLGITLQSNGYSVKEAVTGNEGLIIAANCMPDLIILDLGLPDESGHIILQRLREWYKGPIIILSVLNNEEDIVGTLDNGANDYLIKPFRTGELLARIRSALRNATIEENVSAIHFKGIEIDFSTRIVKMNDELLKLTVTQYTLLSLFTKNEGKVLTHQYILREIWGPDNTDQMQYLRVFVGQLRKKIEKDPNRPEHIITESGVGYRFVAET